jgi:hypothetical protein
MFFLFFDTCVSSFLVTFTTDWEFHYEGFKMVFYTKGNSTQPPTTATPATTGTLITTLIRQCSDFTGGEARIPKYQYMALYQYEDRSMLRVGVALCTVYYSLKSVHINQPVLKIGSSSTS